MMLWTTVLFFLEAGHLFSVRAASPASGVVIAAAKSQGGSGCLPQAALHISCTGKHKVKQLFPFLALCLIGALICNIFIPAVVIQGVALNV
jgi:hypothetical protein